MISLTRRDTRCERDRNRLGLSFVLLATLASVGGCQRYERAPLDMDATRSTWLARRPSDQSVRDFAAQIRASVPDPARIEFNPDDGLTLLEAEAVAMVFNAQLRQARAKANVTQASAAHAGLWEDPVLGVDLERIITGAGDANRWVASGTVGFTIPISGRLGAEKAHASAELHADLARVAAQEWRIRAKLRATWLEWSAARLRADLAESITVKLSEVSDLAHRQEQAGSMTRLDARMFRVEIASRRVDTAASNLRVIELEHEIRELLGLAPNAGVMLTPTVLFSARPLSSDDALHELERGNLDLVAARHEYEVAERVLHAETRKQYPDLVIGPGYGTDQGDDRVLLGLSLPLPLWNRNQQAVATAQAEREAARASFESAYEQLASRLALARHRLAASRELRSLIESEVIPLADDQEADARHVMSLGRVDPLLLLESLKAQASAKLRLVDATLAESLACVAIDELIGPPATTADTQSTISVPADAARTETNP